LCGTESIRKIESSALKPSRALAQQIALTLLVPAAEHDAFVAFARTVSQTAPASAFAAPPPRGSPVLAAAPEGLVSRALPRPLTSFVGRVREIQAAVMLLRRPDVALVTLSGPPGAGKTRLSLAIAEQMGEDFADGVYFVPLAAINDSALVLPAIAEALGVPEAAHEPPIQAVKRYLRERRVLLILDNFEQIVAAGADVAELLAAAPHTKALISSRAVLKVYGEHEFAVASLPVPSLKPLPPLEAVALYAAVQLFMQRAQAVRPGIALNPANAEAIAGICAALDGLPLAIEMAAARMKWREPEALLLQLRRHLSGLSNDVRNLPPRQQTLRGAIDVRPAWALTGR
jgi:predicted ATPase